MKYKETIDNFPMDDCQPQEVELTTKPTRKEQREALRAEFEANLRRGCCGLLPWDCAVQSGA